MARLPSPWAWRARISSLFCGTCSAQPTAPHRAMGSITSQVLRAAASGSAKSDTARISMMAKVSTGPLMRSTSGPIRKLPSTPPMPQTHRYGVTERTAP
ncbi:hypothetical protein D9M70_620630 [compost metagenome]